MEWLIVTLASFAAGLVDAIVGGGGLILIPALFTTFPDTSPATLFGTNKSAAVWGTGMSAWQYGQRVRRRWSVLLPAFGCAMLGSLLGAWAVTQVDPSFLRRLLPLLGLARSLSVEDGTVTIERAVDGYTETVRAALPAVVSVTDQINEPRYPAFAAMKAARKKPLDQWGIDDLVEVPGGEALVMRRALTAVTHGEEKTRDGSGTIIQDAGEGGRALADYILSVVK